MSLFQRFRVVPHSDGFAVHANSLAIKILQYRAGTVGIIQIRVLSIPLSSCVSRRLCLPEGAALVREVRDKLVRHLSRREPTPRLLEAHTGRMYHTTDRIVTVSGSSGNFNRAAAQLVPHR